MNALKRLQTIWSIVGVALLLVVAVDFALASLLKGSEEVEDLAASVRRKGLPDEPWVEGFLDETTRSAQVDWKPYVYWQRKPFQGSYINVGTDGIRQTWRPEPSSKTQGRSALAVFMFGGSTLWGSGARDEHTIPSELSRLLATENIGAAVVNFGEMGYVSTQEVVKLTLELQKGNVPQLVIFYDGVNDLFSSLQAGHAGWPQNEAHRVAEFNILGSRRRLFRAGIKTGIERSGLGRLANLITRPAEGDESASGLVNEELARETIETYKKNIEIVEGLGRAFGFGVAFFWQPAIFTKTPLTQYEQERQREHAYATEMYRRVTALVRNDSSLHDRAHFLDLSGVFENDDAQRYLDFCHTNESANLEIALRMREHLRRLSLL